MQGPHIQVAHNAPWGGGVGGEGITSIKPIKLNV